jgi:hypothetical protein
MAGAALVSVIVSVHVLGVDERLQATEAAARAALDAAGGVGEAPHRVAVRLRHRDDAAKPGD